MQCVDSAPHTVTTVGPFKKRRGRPPKYLNIWQEQHMLKKDMFINVSSKVHIDSEKGATWCGRESIIDEVHQENEFLQNQSLASQHSGQPECDERRTIDEGNAKDEGSDGRLVTTTPTDQAVHTAVIVSETCVTHEFSKQLPEHTECDTTSEEANHEVKNPLNAKPATATVLPMKRRPGRPPGSTKRVKVHANLHTPLPQHQEFSLRKFFEAGGRDYNSYLEWLKQKSCLPKDSQPECSLTQPLHPRPSQVPPLQALRPCLVTRDFLLPASPAAGTTPPVITRSQITLSSQGAMPITPPDTARQPSNSPTIESEQTEPAHLSRHSDNAVTQVDVQDAVSFGCGVLDLSTKKVEGWMERKGNCTADNRSRCDSYHRRHATSCAEKPMREWNVEEVGRFVGSIPGCQEYVELFNEHCIDGTALRHLSEEHLLNFVKMKLGPAIRLRLAISQVVAATT